MSQPVSDVELLRLLQLASPTLPVGAYAFSQGLEWAVAAGWVGDEASLAEWLADQLEHALGGVDLPIFARLYGAARRGEAEDLDAWRRQLIALRETRELLADDCERGRALIRLLRELEVPAASDWATRDAVPFALALAIASVAWGVQLAPATQTYAWGWLENQVLAGVKLIPLGQVAGQRLLFTLAPRIPALCRRALAVDDDEIGGMLPIVALASSLHETQYTRLFRS